MITVEIDTSVIRARLNAMPGSVKASLVHEVTGLRLKLEATVKRKLSGEVLNVITGALRRSIYSDQTASDVEVEGRVAQSADVKYGRIHEYGGTTKPHDIVPTKAAALAFVSGGKTVFAKIVHHPGSVIPERSFMRSSLKDMSGEIQAGLKRAVIEGAK